MEPRRKFTFAKSNHSDTIEMHRANLQHTPKTNKGQQLICGAGAIAGALDAARALHGRGALCARARVRTHARVRMCACVRVFAHAYVRTRACMRLCVGVFVRVRAHACGRAWLACEQIPLLTRRRATVVSR